MDSHQARSPVDLFIFIILLTILTQTFQIVDFK